MDVTISGRVLTPLGVAVFLLVLARLAFPRLRGFKTSSDTLSRFPPGPPSIPVLGNVHQLPQEYQERTFADWGKSFGEYSKFSAREDGSLKAFGVLGAGDVVYAKIFRRPLLVLNSLRAAQDLLEKKSANFSDRPRLILLAELYVFQRWEPSRAD